MGQSNSGLWEVPYLPIDPKDIGRSYEAIIRVNSQSGKGGIAYILHREHGLDLPRPLQIAFAEQVQNLADSSGQEITPKRIWRAFEETYLNRNSPIEFVEHRSKPATHASERRVLTATIRDQGAEREITGQGNGPIDAFLDALAKEYDIAVSLLDFHEHAVGGGADAKAAAYVVLTEPGGVKRWGVGIHANIVTASLRAVVSAVNQLVQAR